MNQRTRALTASLAAMIVASTMVGSASAASPDAAPWLPDIEESNKLNGPTLIQGLLVDDAGRPAPGRVTVVAWPPQDVLGSLEVGDSVKTAPVAKATTGANGRFALKVDPTVPLGEFMQPDGTVNFDVWSETSDGWSVFSFPRTLANDASPAWVAPEAASDAKTTDVPALEVTLEPDKSLGSPKGSARAPAPVTSKSCTETVVATYNQRIGIVGEVYSGPHSTADFQYISGSSSTLGVAFDTAALPVNFSVSGTSDLSSTSTIEYPTQALNKKTVFQSTFQYKKFSASCISGLIWVFIGHFVRPTAFQGGVSSYAAAAAPTATNCSSVSIVPTTITKDTASAITFSNGLNISGNIGIDLSLKTGFNTSTKIKHIFSAAGQLCGSNAAWPDAARIVGK